VSVIGASSCTADEEAFAEGLGNRLAKAGIVTLTGGRGGVMAAASKGAASAGGLTVGFLPGSDVSKANEWVRVALPTGLGELRNALVVRAGMVVVAIGGEYGTLSEMALALKWGKRVIGWRTWRPTKDDLTITSIISVASVDEAMSHIDRVLKRPGEP
jgi:uncharacterized protein (TIGR00725 family)